MVNSPLREKAQRLHRLPSMMMFVDIDSMLDKLHVGQSRTWESYATRELPTQIIRVAMDFGKVRGSVLYSQQRAPDGAPWGWGRYGYHVSITPHIAVDMLERVLTADPRPHNVVVLTMDPDLAEPIRRLRAHVDLVAVVTSQDAPEALKRAANLYVSIREAFGADEEVETRVYAAIKEHEANGLDSVVIGKLLTQLQTSRNVRPHYAKQALSALERKGRIEFFERNGRRVCRSVKADGGANGAA